MMNYLGCIDYGLILKKTVAFSYSSTSFKSITLTGNIKCKIKLSVVAHSSKASAVDDLIEG